MTMTEPTKSDPAGPASNVSISYCPDLGLYHYTKLGEPECLFTDKQLEEVLDEHLKAGRKPQAEVMALLTAFARRYPHRVVSFDEHEACSIGPVGPKKA